MVEKTETRKPAVFIQTYGCEMNKYDSEIVNGILTSEGFSLAGTIDNADIVLINTCSVRDHAEKRALCKIDVIARWKKTAPHRKLGVIGCMAQRFGENLLHQKPFLDFIVGPDEYRKLPDIMSNGQHNPSVQTRLCQNETYSGIPPVRQTGISGWVAIMRGCNNFCSYCIVPYTRGRERSRPALDILQEIKQMAEDGFREVTLLGQNVNSYTDGHADFPDLLERTSQIPGIFRIRFITSHPKDLSDKLLEVIASNEKICPHIHLPLQSGSNRILKLMNRGYSREDYLNLIEKARTFIPGVALTSDIMVGFPGETESDFLDTCDLVETIRFDDAFTYRYSPRQGTKAVEMTDHLSEKDKLDRLDWIIKLQRRITLEKKQEMIGHRVEVLPERRSKKSTGEWMGKTITNHVVVFPKKNVSIGQPVEVTIQECQGLTLRGNILTPEFLSLKAKPGRKQCGS